MEETIEVTYTVFGFEGAGETTFGMDVSERNYNRLQDAEDEGEILDQDFISTEMKGLHKKILREIRNNMEEESWDPDDGKVEKTLPWGSTYKEWDESSSHEFMKIAEDDDIEYTISLL